MKQRSYIELELVCHIKCFGEDNRIRNGVESLPCRIKTSVYLAFVGRVASARTSEQTGRSIIDRIYGGQRNIQFLTIEKID